MKTTCSYCGSANSEEDLRCGGCRAPLIEIEEELIEYDVADEVYVWDVDAGNNDFYGKIITVLGQNGKYRWAKIEHHYWDGVLIGTRFYKDGSEEELVKETRPHFSPEKLFGVVKEMLEEMSIQLTAEVNAHNLFGY